ncbi:MAG: hypothetical protein LQ346_008653, partial [Caloplaca aetnensis]
YQPVHQPSKKRHREETEHPLQSAPPQNRPRPTHSPEPATQTAKHQATTNLGHSHTTHITHWAQQGQVWPTEFFMVDKMLARRKSVTSLRRKRSDPGLGSSVTPSDVTTNDAPYRHPNYEFIMEKEGGSFLRDHVQGITQESEAFCQSLLDTQQAIPGDTIFRDDVFAKSCAQLQGKNEARIFKDCTPLIVPGAETHALLKGDPTLDVAIESVNEGWESSNPITKTRPQPDYAVGFSRNAFLDEQLKKLAPYMGDPWSMSYIMGTYYMLFPFLTCEVKNGGSVGLDVADRQNLHSMTLAVRGIVELFRLVNRAQELHRRVLAFSVSHDHNTARIYGHYPVVEGGKTTYYRYPIRNYSFTERKGLERWTAYRFTKNVYDIWMPELFGMISSAVDQVSPEQDIEAGAPAPGPDISESTGLSQQLDNQGLVEIPDSYAGAQQLRPDISAKTAGPVSKKKK